MAISDEEKVDLLWKKFIYGVSKTETPDNKSPSNETRSSPIVALGNEIWINAKDIPTAPPAASTDYVQVKTVAGEGATQLTMIQDSSDAKAWRAFEEDGVTPLQNWIPFSLGSAYALKLWVGDPSVQSPAPTMLFLDGSGNNDEYFFDYKAGILYFIGENLPVNSSDNLYIEGYRYIGPTDISVFDSGGGSECGNEIKLCEPTDGSLSDPALTGNLLGVEFNKGVGVNLTTDTFVTDAIDKLNETLGLLVPSPPGDFPNDQNLVFPSTGNNPLLVANFQNNSGNFTFSPGDPIVRIPLDTNNPAIAQSNTITSSGPGMSGVLFAFTNNAVFANLGEISFDETDNTSNGVVSAATDSLKVTNNYWYPSETPGFWQAFDTRVTLNIAHAYDASDTSLGRLEEGLNKVTVQHLGGGQISTIFVLDSMVDLPNIDMTTVQIQSIGTNYKFSSGVPHYQLGQVVQFQQIGISHVAGQTYCGDSFFEIFVDDNQSRGTTQNPFNKIDKDYDFFGIATPLSSWIAMQYQNPVSVTFNNNHCAKLFQAKVKVTNVNG